MTCTLHKNTEKQFPKLEDVPKEFYLKNTPPDSLNEAFINLERLNQHIKDIEYQMEERGKRNENQLKSLRVKTLQKRMYKEWLNEYYPEIFIKYSLGR